jgi:hypothetical protein
LLPIFLAVMSLLLTYELDGQNRRRAQDSRILELRTRLEEAVNSRIQNGMPLR